jgi:hypothetical protein
MGTCQTGMPHTLVSALITMCLDSTFISTEACARAATILHAAWIALLPQHTIWNQMLDWGATEDNLCSQQEAGIH